MLKLEEKKKGFLHNSRDYWALLGSKGEYRSWFNQLVQKHNFKEGEDFLLKKIESNGGRPRSDAFLTEGALRAIQLSYGKHKYDVIDGVVEKTIDADLLVKNILSNPRQLAKIFIDFAEAQDRLEIAEDKLHVLEQSPELLTASIIAKDLGYESAIELNKNLNELGLIFKSGKNWLPYSNKVPKDCYEIKTIISESGNTYTYLKWTLKGKVFISEKLRGVKSELSVCG